MDLFRREEIPTGPGQPPLIVIPYGPDSNCTLAICPVDYSVYKYRPNLGVNIFFLVAFALAMLVHIYFGIRWKSWGFMSFMIAGCLSEVIGYIGRLLLYYNPFSFAGFMLQIVFITSGPVYFTASIYVTLSKTIEYFAPEISRLKPKLFYWIFIPADVICLALQAAGGAISSSSSGSSQSGVDIAMAGLILQVIVLSFFIALFADYMILYKRQSSTRPLNRREQLFFASLGTAVVLILGRCFYRCYELSKGYSDSDLITNEGLFIGLEGVLIILAVIVLFTANPGIIFAGKKQTHPGVDEETATEQKTETDSSMPATASQSA